MEPDNTPQRTSAWTKLRPGMKVKVMFENMETLYARLLWIPELQLITLLPERQIYVRDEETLTREAKHTCERVFTAFMDASGELSLIDHEEVITQLELCEDAGRHTQAQELAEMIGEGFAASLQDRKNG